MLTLLTLPVNSRRDVLLARQRARQIAALLHFESVDQACIAAGTFAVAQQALRRSRAAQLYFRIDKKMLHVFAQATGKAARTLPLRQLPAGVAGPDSSLRLAKALPAGTADFSNEDLIWVIEQLNQQPCFHPFEEIQHQNQEMLALLHALHSAQAQVRQLLESRPAPSAA